jgi:hypothetical protein
MVIVKAEQYTGTVKPHPPKPFGISVTSIPIEDHEINYEADISIIWT